MSKIKSSVQPKHVGSYGELKATLWLMDQGYDVFRNVSSMGLIDLVAIKDDEVLKIDVKYSRTGNKLGASSKGSNATIQREKGIKWLYVLGDKFEIADAPDAKGRETRKCSICQKHFRTNIGSAQKTCSPECSAENEHRRRKEREKRRLRKKRKAQEHTKPCVICEKQFTAPSLRKETCSKECSKEYAKRRSRVVYAERRIHEGHEETKTCITCGNAFTTTNKGKKTCSKKCSARNQHERRRDRDKRWKREHAIGSTTKHCIMCHQPFATTNGVQNTCSDKCVGERMAALNKERYQKNKERGHGSGRPLQKLSCV